MSDGSQFSSNAKVTSVDLTGRKFGDLQILRRLGRGGMADVYVANQLTLGRQVALKVLRPDLARDANYVERFRREARAAARLSQPNIVQIYEVGCVDSMYFISQEYVDGLNLRQQLERSGPLSPDQAVVVLQSVADALAAAREAGITHRDIKPENIMISRRGEVKVTDFGLAAVSQADFKNDLTQVGMTMGTPLYMSPEQIQGAGVDVRSDLYSLGVTMYHLMVGRPPFEADTPLALAVKHLHETATPIEQARPIQDLPDWLCRAIDKLMAKEPAQRFQSPEELNGFIQQNLSKSGPLGDASATLATRLDATKTLQHLMNQESRGRLWAPLMIISASVLVPMAALAIGVWYGQQQPERQLTTILQPGDLEIPIFDTVEEQYLTAARLNEPEAWRKVAEVFPAAESQKNLSYAMNSTIQLARLYRKREQYSSAKTTLQTMLSNPEIGTLYRAVALAELHETQLAAGESATAEKTRSEVRDAYDVLKQTPGNQTIFNELYPSYQFETLKQS